MKEAKSNQFSRLEESLNNPVITHEEYWSVLHGFLHKPKIPRITLIRHNKTFLTDTLVKANTFNSFFAKQCSLIETTSEVHVHYLRIHHRLESVNLDPAFFLLFVLLMLAKLMSGTMCLCVWSKFLMNLWLSFFL